MVNKSEKIFDYLMPRTNRVNLGKTYRSLEDAAFHISEPRLYEELERQVAPIQAEDTECLKILKKAASLLLRRNGIKGNVQGRLKSLYSIHAKMARKGVTLETIMDRIGLRIIVATVPECYRVLGLLHAHFRPVPATFTDYIGQPKENGYQSLHTCVYPLRDISHKTIEFQVRTELMHKEAEYGSAAHWKYKEGATLIAAGDVANHPGPKDPGQKPHTPTNTGTFIELLSQQVDENHMVIFGRDGQKVRLPENATVEQYLLKAQQPLSPRSLIKVNRKIVGLSHILKDTDTLEIIDPSEIQEKCSLPPQPAGQQPSIPGDPTPSRSTPPINYFRLPSRQFTPNDLAKTLTYSGKDRGATTTSAEMIFCRKLSSTGAKEVSKLYFPDFKKGTVQ